MDPFFGAVPSQDGVRFRIWAPEARALGLVLLDGAAAGTHPLAAAQNGVHETWVRGARGGDRYAYAVEGARLPDPASRFQPDGVHGPSQIVDPAFDWQDAGWQSRPARDLILYELHTGTFTPEGTFDGVRRKLPYLRDLGVTAIELMPVADFPGARNWGYDGVALFAPSRAYGRPEDLRRLVDEAHRHGLSVILDVVYNHLGPEGAYLTTFSRGYVTSRHQTPWGDAVNLDGPGSPLVRRFIIDNAVHWVREYHVDGLRLDATHALIDDSPTPIVVELAEAVRAAAGRHIIVHAEDHRNLASMIEDRAAGGWGLDGVWADDFHHVVRSMTAGDAHGYFADFTGEAGELATIVRNGWLYSGQFSAHRQEARGTDPGRVPMYRFVVCIQNHDQIGNRAMGERLHHEVAPAAWRAASVLLLTVPMTPLLFMGQEWAASTPFQYFTDVEPELGRKVTEGRRREFAEFPAFASPEQAARIPDPQAERTFLDSRLKWNEAGTAGHARTLALYRALLALRRDEPALSGGDAVHGSAEAPDDETILVTRNERRTTFVVAAHFGRGTEIELPARNVTVILDTEHAEFADEPMPIDILGSTVRFQRPGAVILRLS